MDLSVSDAELPLLAVELSEANAIDESTMNGEALTRGVADHELCSDGFKCLPVTGQMGLSSLNSKQATKFGGNDFVFLHLEFWMRAIGRPTRPWMSMIECL
ncbi:hypothetical protein ASPCAL11584 [Aspergillus calidoustus]|uniref:Uncharacterized protein n=1 Tax=Aspergillus calidoustus TaxID=454130 RepID=A0A0U5G895_ASPCI|nr:hypothetical protein ASPCAL11584 [Aspergillus calidoustus]